MSRRYCPMCGQHTPELRCPNDGAITVVRRAQTVAPVPVEIGDVVGGRFRVAGVIGRGGYGVVLRANHTVTGQEVALKVLHVEGDKARREALKRFDKEGRVLGSLQHPSTVRIFDVGSTDAGAPYIAMELVDGPNLEQLFAHLNVGGRALTEAQAIDIVLPILGSLTEAHGLGLVHRDLKPANVMLTEVADEPLVVKVVDFGVVRTHDSDLTTRNSSIGTPRYMSPEQCRGESVDARSDLYALGCVLYEAVAGRPPFASRNHVDTMSMQMNLPVPPIDQHAQTIVSDGFRAALDRALAKDPKRRFPTAGAMRRALANLRRQAWGNVPVTPLHVLLQTDSHSSWRVVVDTNGSAREDTRAGVRSGAVTGASKTAVSPTAVNDTDEILGIAQQVIDTHVDAHAGALAAAAAAAIEGHAIPSFEPRSTAHGLGLDGGEAAPGSQREQRPFDASPSQEWVKVSRRELEARLAESSPAAAPVPDPGTDPDPDGPLPFDTSESQELVPLPSRRRIEAAIAERLAAESSGTPASEEPVPRDPPTVIDAEDPSEVRHVQVAPRSARDSRRRHKGTLIGTGISPLGSDD